jgi:arginase family enzyme
MPKSTTTVYVCPFALFGNAGTQHGAELLGDAVRELLDDSRRERRACRSAAFRERVRVEELPLATPGDYAAWRTRAGTAVSRAVDAGSLIVWLGGNHLSVLPVYEHLARLPKSLVVQLDAHLDVYHYDDCVTELSHGNFLRHLDPRPAVVNLGHRDQFLPTAEIARWFAAAHAAADLFADEAAVMRAVGRRLKAAERVWLDIDCDVFDPAYFPAVVDAVAFGLSPPHVWRVFLQLVETGRLCGVSISEFDPGRDDRDRSLQLAAWLVEQLLLAVHG